VFRYKGHDQDLASLGRELNVGAVLTGQIRVHGGDISVRAELVDIINDRQLWGERYTLDLAEVLLLEQKIAAEISDALKLHLTSTDRDRLVTYHTENSKAHRLYLKGRYFWNKRSEAGLKNAIDYFRQAIEEDPAYAMPHSGVADCYIVLSAFAFLSPSEAFPRAKAAALKALEIDETLAEAHTSLAFVLASYEWEWEKAENEYKRAIELSSTYATTFQWYAYLLRYMGRGDEAIAAAERAVELDPLSFPVIASAGYTRYALRQYDEAEKICLTVLDMEPEFAMARSVLGMVYLQKGLPGKALGEWKLAAELSNDAPEDMAYLGLGYAWSNMEREARRILEEFDAQANTEYVPPSFLAMIHAGLGEKDEAFDWLNQAYEQHDYYVSYYLTDPVFDPLRDDPRLNDLMQRIGLDPSHFAPAETD
jgi:tetratricopeptide (TPR) repeat protein